MASFQEEQPVRWYQSLVAEHHNLDLALVARPLLEEAEHLIVVPSTQVLGDHLIGVMSIHHWSTDTGCKVLVQESIGRGQAVAMEVAVGAEDSVPCLQM